MQNQLIIARRQTRVIPGDAPACAEHTPLHKVGLQADNGGVDDHGDERHCTAARSNLVRPLHFSRVQCARLPMLRMLDQVPVGGAEGSAREGGPRAGGTATRTDIVGAARLRAARERAQLGGIHASLDDVVDHGLRPRAAVVSRAGRRSAQARAALS